MLLWPFLGPQIIKQGYKLKLFHLVPIFMYQVIKQHSFNPIIKDNLMVLNHK